MFTVAGWSESQDPGGVFVGQTAIPDQHIRVEGDSLFIQEFNRLMGGYALDGTVAGLHRLVSPSLRRVNPFYLNPVEQALAPAALPQHCVSPDISVILDPNEQLQSEYSANPAGAEQCSAFAWLADSEITSVKGEIRTLRFQVTAALVVNTWAFSEIDFIDELPVGAYDIVGGGLVAATGTVFRFVPTGAHHRPGAPTSTVIELVANDVFRFGRLGVWCTFEQIRPPGVEIACGTAAGSASYEGFMDVIKRA